MPGRHPAGWLEVRVLPYPLTYEHPRKGGQDTCGTYRAQYATKGTSLGHSVVSGGPPGDEKNTACTFMKVIMSPIERLRSQQPWPAEKPAARQDYYHVWFTLLLEKVLLQVCPKPQTVLELGSWTGFSSNRFADMWDENVNVICVDTWKGSPEHLNDQEISGVLPILYETFLVNCWDRRDRIIPIRSDTTEGMRRVFDAGVSPDFVYVDAAHDAASVIQDISLAITFFPKAVIAGDDFRSWPGVVRGLDYLMKTQGVAYGFDNNTWWLLRNV